ncbi:MAG: hypothetical protein AAB617_00250 [Patescibacteria group bacterium]
MSLPKIIGLGLVLSVLGWGLFNLIRDKNMLNAQLNDASKVLSDLETENKNLSAKIEYFKIPENLVKELKSQFNYHESGEKLIIVVPSATSTR